MPQIDRKAVVMLATVLLTACASAKPPVTANATARPTAAAYAKLFEKGASWRFHSDYEEGTSADSYDTTCTVSEVRSYAGGVASHVECSRPVIVHSEASEAVAGMWVSDARGLAHASDWEPSGAPTAEYLRIVLPITATDSTVVVDPGSAPDAWCATWDEGDGPAIHGRTCFKEGAISDGEALVDDHGTTFWRTK